MSDERNKKNKKMKKLARKLKIDVQPEPTVDNVDHKKNIDLSVHMKRFQKDFAILGKDVKKSYTYWKDYLARTGQEKMNLFQSKYLNNLRIMKR